MIFKHITFAIVLASLGHNVHATNPPDYVSVSTYNSNCGYQDSSDLIAFGADEPSFGYNVTCASPVTSSTWNLTTSTGNTQGSGNQCVNANGQGFEIDCGGGAYNNSAYHAPINSSDFTIQIQQDCQKFFGVAALNGQNVTLSVGVTAKFVCDSHTNSSAWTGTIAYDVSGIVQYAGGLSNTCSSNVLVDCTYIDPNDLTTSSTTSAPSSTSSSSSSASNPVSITGLQVTTLAVTLTFAVIASFFI